MEKNTWILLGIGGLAVAAYLYFNNSSSQTLGGGSSLTPNSGYASPGILGSADAAQQPINSLGSLIQATIPNYQNLSNQQINQELGLGLPAVNNGVSLNSLPNISGLNPAQLPGLFQSSGGLSSFPAITSGQESIFSSFGNMINPGTETLPPNNSGRLLSSSGNSVSSNSGGVVYQLGGMPISEIVASAPRTTAAQQNLSSVASILNPAGGFTLPAIK